MILYYTRVSLNLPRDYIHACIGVRISIEAYHKSSCPRHRQVVLTQLQGLEIAP